MNGELPTDWQATRSHVLDEIMRPAYEKHGREKVNQTMGEAVDQIARFLGVEMGWFNIVDSNCNGSIYGTTYLRARKPMDRAASIRNPIESLTNHEKERLGFILGWIINGPEQGMCRNSDILEYKKELKEFCIRNRINIHGQWLLELEDSKEEQK